MISKALPAIVCSLLVLSVAKAKEPSSVPTSSESSDPVESIARGTSKIHRSLPEALTSFGAATLDGYLYVFSGHSGDAHGFGRDLLVNHFRRIRIDDPAAEWEELAMHEPAQSTALVTDGDYMYRLGGLTFLNPDGEEEAVFHSTAHFARYDINTNAWTELEPLPSPRSSLDAAVVGRTVYVVGGWDLQGSGASRDAPWYDTMHAFDLDHPDAGWQELDGPGYQTRALSVAAHKGKLFALGGISNSGFLRKTSVYDPKTDAWSEGPDLVGDSSMTGFATSTFAVGGHLYSTGASGIVYRLSEDGESWEVADRLLFPRMFLRLLPAGGDKLIALGGTGGMTGRTSVVETLQVDPAVKVGEKLVSWSVPYEGETKHSQALVLDGTALYAFGGNKSWQPHDFSREAFSAEAFKFNVVNQSVQRLPDLPFPVQSGAGVVNKQTSEHKTLAVLGGMNFGASKFNAIGDILEFDPESEVWSSADTQLPEPRSMANAVAHEDALWLFGGSDAGLGAGLRERVLHWWGDTTEIAPLPEIGVPHPRRSFGGVMIGNEYFMIGGLGSGMSIESHVDVFNLADRTWREAASPFKARVFPTVAVDGKKIYLFGGFSNENGHFAEDASLEVYDSETDSWSLVSESIDGVDASMRLFNLAGRLLFFGIDRERDGFAKFVLYDPNPTVAPAEVAAMSFGGGRRRAGGDAEANAKMLMRKDSNKDGLLSLQELGKRMSDFVKQADTDGDTLVSFQEAKSRMEADEKAELETAAKENESGTDEEPDAAEVSDSATEAEVPDPAEANRDLTVEEAQRRADELQRAADAAQRAADKAQRAADALRRRTVADA
ncbi:MAG: kelch repeat-containing protein [Planctomycetota bacterium]